MPGVRLGALAAVVPSAALLLFTGCHRQHDEVRAANGEALRVPAPTPADALKLTLAKALKLSVPWTGHRGWTVMGGVDGSFVPYARAHVEQADGTFLTITVFDLGDGPVMTAAGDLEQRPWPEQLSRGFKQGKTSEGRRTLYRLNPPGDFFGGQFRVFVDDRFVVDASGSHLTMESISDHANRVARALSDVGG